MEPENTTPQPGTDLVLTPPKPVEQIETDKASAMVPIDTAKQNEVTTKAQATASSLANINPTNPAFRSQIQKISTLGTEQAQRGTEATNAILSRPSLAKGTSGDKVSSSLAELRSTITELDPHRADLKGAKKALKWIPGGSKIDKYFAKYETNQAHLNAIIASLEGGQDDLRKDNAAVQLEQTRLWEVLTNLREIDVELAELDKAIEAEIERLTSAGETQKAEALKSQALFAVRQRRQDLATEVAVSVQGYMSLGLVLQNNDQLIQAVDRAKTTTVAALYTAVIVSEALARQRLVLDQINALRSTTSNMIEATSKQLREQGAEINAKSTEALIEVDKLENAFTNVFATMDAIDTYRSAATDSMAKTITALQGQIQRAQPYLERAHQQQIESGRDH